MVIARACTLYLRAVQRLWKKLFWMWPRNTVNITVQNWKLLNFSQQFHSVFLSPFLTGLDAFCDSYTVSCMTGVHHLQALTSLFSTDCCVLANPLRFLSELHFPVNWPFLQCWCLFLVFLFLYMCSFARYVSSHTKCYYNHLLCNTLVKKKTNNQVTMNFISSCSLWKKGS